MRAGTRERRGASVFDELAVKLREMALGEQLNAGSGMERYQVQRLAPLTLVELDGELILTDGDPDFTIGATLHDRLTAASVSEGAMVWVARHQQEWHAFDVVSG